MGKPLALVPTLCESLPVCRNLCSVWGCLQTFNSGLERVGKILHGESEVGESFREKSKVTK